MKTSMNTSPCLNTSVTVQEWTSTTQQPSDYLQGDYLDRLQICALILKTQTCSNNGQKLYKDTKGIGCGNTPSIPIMVEQIADNNDQTSQVASFGKGIKEINPQDKPPVHAFSQETQMPWIHLQSLRKQQQRPKKRNAKKKADVSNVANKDTSHRTAQTAVTEESDTTSIATAKTPTPAEIAGFLNQFSISDKEEFVMSMRELGEDVGFQEA
jgi:hypothetical protein